MIAGLLDRAVSGKIPLWGWGRMSCHVDVFLLMEHAVYVFNPERGTLYGTSQCAVTKALLCTILGLATPNRDSIRDVFWRSYLTHPHSDAVGTMGDVETHVRTFAGIYRGSRPLSSVLKIFNKIDRWITYDMRENCTTVNCNYNKTHKVMMHALVLPEIIMTEKGTREYETSLTHGVLRALMQSSGVRQKCPECKDYTSLLRTKLVETITLPRRLAVALDSGGRLCNEDPPVSLDICDGRAYVLVGIAIRNSAHYRCNVRIGDGWYHYDDGGGNPKPVFFPITSPSYVPFPSYKRRMLYYSLRSDAPVRGAQLRVPTWMSIRGGTEGDNCQEELVE